MLQIYENFKRIMLFSKLFKKIRDFCLFYGHTFILQIIALQDLEWKIYYSLFYEVVSRTSTTSEFVVKTLEGG